MAAGLFYPYFGVLLGRRQVGMVYRMEVLC